LYTVMGTFSKLGFGVERFDKISDFTRTAAIVPTSAKTGEGIPELLGVLVGLTQQYLRARLKVTKGPAKGTVLEVKEEPGLGTTINAIIYDGTLQKGDMIVVGGKEKPIRTNVRAVLLPKALDEIRDPRDRFSSVDAVSAAAGIKIAAPNLDNALAGAPLYVVPVDGQPEAFAKLVSEEVEKLRVDTDIDGVVLKTDALGSLEAIAESLKRNNVPIRLADVGILAFNVKTLPDAEKEAIDRRVFIFEHNIIYHLVDDYLKWMKSTQEERIQRELDRLVRPGKIKILPGYVFRKAKPAIVGIEVLAGQIKPKYALIGEDGRNIGEIKQIQDRGQAIPEAKTEMQVAISLDKPVVGRHINEGDVLLVKVPEEHVKALLTKFQDRLSSEELDALNELVDIMRRQLPLWAA